MQTKYMNRGSGRAFRSATAAPYSRSSSSTRRIVSGNKRLFVGNLSWNVSWQSLKDYFSQIGPVAYADVMTEPSGRSKGCGIVEYEHAQYAEEAIRRLHDTELDGRLLLVREDKEAGSAGGSGKVSDELGRHVVRSSAPAAPAVVGRRLYVGNLSWDVAWQDLKDHFKQIGEVVRADVMTEPSGRSKGCGLIEYARHEDAIEAAERLNDTDLKGRKIFVREDREDASLGAAGTRLYVGNLSWEVAWQDLKDHFKQIGEVVRADVMTEPSGRSKGCGLVEFANPADAQRAIQTLNDSVLSGRPIFVREDREAPGATVSLPPPPVEILHTEIVMTDRSAPMHHYSSGSAAGGASGSKLYVGNLSFNTSWQHLKDHFKPAGVVIRAEIVADPATGRPKGFGIVEMGSPSDAANAIAMLNNSTLDDRKLFVKEDRRP